MSDPRFVPLNGYCSYPEEEMRERAADFNQEMQRRRTVRDYSSREIPLDVIEDCLRTAGSAPSGAHRQPWHFVVVTDPEVKHRIREAAEAEEIEFYRNRAPSEWLEALAPLGTDENKEYLDTAPCLIAVFAESYGLSEEGKKVKNYYSQESVGIATGMLICALHHAGLATLTHTPSPMGFLNEILGRPGNERPFLLLVVGYPAEDAKVPDLNRKSLDEFASFS
jgi:iodotyrosine deiodinase